MPTCIQNFNEKKRWRVSLSFQSKRKPCGLSVHFYDVIKLKECFEFNIFEIFLLNQFPCEGVKNLDNEGRSNFFEVVDKQKIRILHKNGTVIFVLLS